VVAAQAPGASPITLQLKRLDSSLLAFGGFVEPRADASVTVYGANGAVLARDTVSCSS
jgi:hypothetical protein